VAVAVQVYVLWAVVGAAALLVWGAVLAGLRAPVASDPLTLRYFSGPFLSRAEQYQRVSLTVYLVRQAMNLLLLTAAALAAWRYFAPGQRLSIPAAAGYLFLFLLLLQLLNLPLAYYRGFVIEHRFELSSYSAAGWLLDYAKSGLISLLLTTAALAGLYFLMLRFTGRWWLPAGLLLTFFMFLGVYIFPVVIDPLFYRFTPLEDQELNSAIVDMAAEAGIAVDQVLVADASRRTTKANAYFTGLGRTKRIVVFDTLLHRFSREEVLSVVAHEMGHWRHGHIFKGIILGAAGGFAALGLLFLLLEWMGEPPGFRAAPLAFLFLTVLALGFAPVENYISREFERQADREALALAGDAETFISMQQRLAVANLAVARPHPLIKFALYTHPPVMERIACALEKQGG